MKKEKAAPKAEKKEKTAPETEEKAPETEEQPVEEKKEPTAEEKLQEALDAEKDKYIRLYAEYDNYRKRTSAEKLQIYDDAKADAVKELLPLADSMTNALAQFEGKDVPEEFGKGIALIAQQLKQSFEKLKVEPFGEVGDAFDPALHNAVSTVEDENLPENAISAVYQKGYKIGDKIIRHAMVVVANS
ncbi:nucleotide exchange factor GrpE [Ruminococcus sp.]|uniref:nucleotide exchange factor GrpE n=1 Tax=Ruminococcus sp. TaxID=41978 RepID=UPI00388F9349